MQTPEQAYFDAIHFAKRIDGSRMMKSPAGEMAFQKTGAMDLKSPTAEVQARFIKHYQAALVELEKKRSDFFSNLKSQLG